MKNNLLNNIAENNTIGMTQFKSIKKPNIRLPIKAPPRPNVNDRAAAITLYVIINSIQFNWNTIYKLLVLPLKWKPNGNIKYKYDPIDGRWHFSVYVSFFFFYLKFVGNKSTITQYTVDIPSDVRASNMQDNIKFSTELCTKYNPIVTVPATTRLNTISKQEQNTEKKEQNKKIN